MIFGYRLRRGCVLLAATAVVWAAAATTSPAPPAPPTCTAARDVEASIFLIGDAGKPRPGGEPVLQAVRREASQDARRSVVVFLGDNVYPQGLPPAVDSTAPRDLQERREKSERILDAQIEAVPEDARGIFVPGNHDWAHEGPEGWAAVRRQEEYVTRRGASRVRFLPRGGCPGPTVLDEVGARLRIVALDTQWWLQAGPKPPGPGSDCTANSPNEVVDALREALLTAGERQVVVVAHHPLLTGGPHGGHFGLKAHLFPLTERKKWLWVPLPGLGSIYPLARRSGVSPQDVSNDVNQAMRDALEKVLAERPPLAYASGHEHTLQVLDKPALARLLLVSGTGIYGHVSPVSELPETRYAASASGFMRLDLTTNGRARLGVLVVDRDSTTHERYCRWVE